MTELTIVKEGLSVASDYSFTYYDGSGMVTESPAIESQTINTRRS